jgi:flagellar motility protein MotE (MotC chaperone)
MASAVRVLPALIAVGIGALAFKSVDIYQAVAQAVGEGEAPKPETALTAGVGDRTEDATAAAATDAPGVSPAPPAAPKSDVCLPSVDYAAELGITAGEINVLRSLQSRREELDKREADLSTREQAAAAVESRLEDQIGELKTVEKKVEGLLAQMDAKRDERMTSLVKTYEAMKPKDAAKIFDGMEGPVLLDLAKAMKPANLAAVMSLMQPKKAEGLTNQLADLAKPPASLGDLPASVAPASTAAATPPAAKPAATPAAATPKPAAPPAATPASATAPATPPPAPKTPA